jgi:peptidyl-prolyl cis-trans isomerase SurA
MALVRCYATTAIALATLAAGLSGCSAPAGGSKLAREENHRMDTLIRCGEELEREAAKPVLVARSQKPEILPPVRLGNPASPTSPVTPPALITPANSEGPAPAEGIRIPDIAPSTPPVAPAVAVDPVPPDSTKTDSPLPKLEGDSQVRIVASIGNNPIYESEVREAVYQRMGEYLRLSDSQREIKEREIFMEELRRIIERELVLEEMSATLAARKQTAMLTKFREAASKEADARLRDFKKDRGIPTDAEFRSVLRSQGLTLGGIRRQIERGFMMQTYLREKLSPNMDKISLADIRDYYTAHIDQFQGEDHVKWQDLFVLNERFKSVDEAKQYATHLATRAGKGEDFVKLVAEYGMGDSKLRNGDGVGEKPGEIFPQELEPTILALKQGQVTVKETETGFHVLRVAERTYAGPKPYDEKLQAEIRRRLQNEIFEREAKRFVDTLWKRSQPQIWVK